MAHLLLLDVPGGNDFTILEDAVALGHEVTFFTSDLAHYQGQGETTQNLLALAQRVIEVRPFSYEAFEAEALRVHAAHPFDAILCLIDIRMIESSRLAERLELRFLNVDTTRLMRDKSAVRQRLAERGVTQPGFDTASSPTEIRRAVGRVGYPVLVKPADGYGSQNVSVLRDEADLEALLTRVEAAMAAPADYGLGVHASNRFSVEQYVAGELIGCDIFTTETDRVFLGINDKRMYPPPSFAIRGSCFPSDRFDVGRIRDYAYGILDAVGFDFGAAHIEMIVAEDGTPYLVEVNPRLVSAQIPFQMGYAFERSVYADLIALHLGEPAERFEAPDRHWYSAIRWIVAPRPGILDSVTLPETVQDTVRRVVMFKWPGDSVIPPINNGDRMGYVIAVGESQAVAEDTAERFVAACRVELTEA